MVQKHPLGILDLSPVTTTFAGGLNDSLKTVKAAEEQGYQRYWVAEHHNVPSYASKATTIMMGQLAAATSTIKIGSGGVMIPNHYPLRVAEEIATLNGYFPDRVELGLGRAPGTDPRTAILMRNGDPEESSIEKDINVLEYFLKEFDAETVPLTILGSSMGGAKMAAAMGLNFAVASHFAPDLAQQAIQYYRQNFNPEAETSITKTPHVTATSNVAVAEDEQEARLWFTSIEQGFYNISTGTRGKTLATPTLERPGNPAIWAKVDATLRYSAFGTGQQVAQKLWKIQQSLDADDLLISNYTYDIEARITGNGLLAQAWDDIDAGSSQ